MLSAPLALISAGNLGLGRVGPVLCSNRVSQGAPAVGHARKHFGAMVSASKSMTEAAEVMEIVK